MHTIKYRLSDERLRPRRTKLEIPGWAGKPEPRADGSHEYAWHCVPFSEAAQYGLEVFFPYDNELRVSTMNAHLVFDGDFGSAPGDGRLWPPFRSFGEHFYTYQILLDLKVEAGLAIKIEPHPRFYTDPTGSVPIAVPGFRFRPRRNECGGGCRARITGPAYPREPRYSVCGHPMDFGVEYSIRRHLPAYSWRGEKTSAALVQAGADKTDRPIACGSCGNRRSCIIFELDGPRSVLAAEPSAYQYKYGQYTSR